MDDALRYPIGRFSPPERPTPDDRRRWLEALETLPAELRAAVAGLADAQLDTPYREGGWSPRQIVHHVADSHMNSWIRFRWTLTEDEPVIKAYDQDAWGALPDSSAAPVDTSLRLLEGLHARWLELLRRMGEPDWARVFVHPETERRTTLERTLALYAWHGAHHAAQIGRLRERRGW